MAFFAPPGNLPAAPLLCPGFPLQRSAYGKMRTQCGAGDEDEKLAREDSGGSVPCGSRLSHCKGPATSCAFLGLNTLSLPGAQSWRTGSHLENRCILEENYHPLKKIKT